MEIARRDQLSTVNGVELLGKLKQDAKQQETREPSGRPPQAQEGLGFF